MLRNLETEERDTIEESELVITKSDRAKTAEREPQVESVMEKFGDKKLRFYNDGHRIIVTKGFFDGYGRIRIYSSTIYVTEKKYLELAKKLAVELDIEDIEEDYL